MKLKESTKRLLPFFIGGALLLAALVIALVQSQRAYGAPDDALEQCFTLLGRGDLPALSAEPKCRPFSTRAEQMARAHGRERYEKILGIYLRASQLASTEFDRVVRTIGDLGTTRFHSLPREQQRAIRDRSKNEWVLTRGLARLSEEQRQGITDAATELESTPPDRKTPSGTSDISRRATAASKSSVKYSGTSGVLNV